MTTITIRAMTETTASPDEVWAVLDDFDGWPRWMPSMEHIKVETPPDVRPGPGYRFRLRSGLVHTDMEVVEFGPLTRATSFAISFPPMHGQNRCRLVPLEGGRHRIEREDDLELPEALANLLVATQGQRFARLAREFVTALKRAVEEQAGHAV